MSSISGSALSSDNLHQLHSLSRGEVLAPGAEIDTRGGGLLTIGLSDGSVVVVEPGSRIILKDYSFASSARDLFDILLGRVRVKINHLGGRPNPYRINSPTASIAVRGTEFTVAVDSPGDTRVIVFEGVVEVTSLSPPNQRTLLEGGRGVVVRPNQDMLYFVPIAGVDTPGRELGETNDRSQQNVQNASNERGGRDDESPRNTAGTYQRSIASLVQSGQTPFLLRFVAFADPYLDSLENPCYASEFHALEGRILVIPSFTGSQSVGATSAEIASAQGQPTGYTVSPQFSFFAPLRGGRTVLGGALAASRSGLQSVSLVEETGLTGALFAPGSLGTRSASDSTVNSFLTASFLAAHRFGAAERTSVGFGIDQVSGRGSLLTNQTATAGSVVANERIQSSSSVGQTQFKVGISRNLAGGHKLGLFYRYGLVSASDGDRSRLLNNIPQSLDSSATSGNTSELGIGLRGPLAGRWFYGLEASTLRFRITDSLRRAASVDSHQQDTINRSAIGLGLGYVISPRAVVSFDVAGGVDRTKYRRNEDATGSLLEDQRQSTQFMSAHAAIQADVWRGLFVSGSLLVVHQSAGSALALFPDRFGRTLTIDNLFSPGGIPYDHTLSYYSEFGVGWRFNPGVLIQYVASTNYGLTPPHHTFLLQYTFHPRQANEK